MLGRSRPLKFAIVGDSSVGKTGVLISYIKNTFADERQLAAIDTLAKYTQLDSTKYFVTVVDTSGSYFHDRIRPMSYYYPITDVFLLCYAIDDRDSYENILHKWLPEVRSHCPKAATIIVATKADLRAKIQDPISDAEGTQLRNKANASGFMECSAKTGEHVEDVFVLAVKIGRIKFLQQQKY